MNNHDGDNANQDAQTCLERLEDQDKNTNNSHESEFVDATRMNLNVYLLDDVVTHINN